MELGNKSPEWMLECEARDWIARTKVHGMAWWKQTIKRIEQKRGKEAADRLRRKMNDIRGELSSQLPASAKGQTKV